MVTMLYATDWLEAAVAVLRRCEREEYRAENVQKKLRKVLTPCTPFAIVALHTVTQTTKT
jgi:hypothetical protein